MLTILNHYQHGFVAIPVVLACKKYGLFELCQRSSPLPFDVLVKELRAHSGHLRVALHMLEAMQWLSHDGDDRYALTPMSELHRHIPEDITSLLSFPVREYVSKRSNRLSLKTWVELSGQRWNIQDPTMAHFLDGLLMLPLLLALRERSLSRGSDHSREFLLTALPSRARAEIVALLAGKGWLDHTDRPLSKGGPVLNEAGRFMIERSFITATVASYRPMIMNIAEVIFGNCVAVFQRDATGHETHVDRALNVVGSGFQHERYFDRMEEAILAVFNREPYEDQPRYVADMGCGDGTLLRKIYDLIEAKSLRGKALDRYPVKLIGVDYNAQALEATARSLAGYESLVLQGDIGDPARLIEDLRAQGIQDPEHILHVRSFLDHDRPYKPPLDHAAVKARAHLAYHGVYVDREGHSLPPAAVVQSLVEHLQGWSSIVGHHGLMMLEVHCLEPRTIARFMPQCESLHMDAYHRFSQQLLVEADRFIMAAAEVGLCPEWEFFKKYPNRHPYTRITLSYLRKRDYTIRHPNKADVPVLVAFERHCLPESQAASMGEIGHRIARYPEGQCLLEVDGQLAAVAYSQRISHQAGADERDETVQPAWAHAADGAVAELLYALCPGTGQKTHGYDLVTFMIHWLALKDGVAMVTGAARCERYLDRSAHDLEGLMANVRAYVQRCAIGPDADTRAPEAELSAFGTRWLFRIFQDMGVMTAPHQVYDLKNLIQHLGILPKYERLCAALVRLLAREEVLHIAGDRIEVMPLATTFALQDVEAEGARFAAEFTMRYATYQPFLELMCRCLKQFAEVLTGSVAANDVVFPNGSMDVFAGLFRGHAVADFFNDLVAEIVLANITLARQHAPETGLSILEIGAGTGSTTRVVLEKIQHLASVLSFDSTDISSAFTRYGEKTLSERFPWVKFNRLNIEEDPVAQGFQSQGFDLIYAANTLHDTRNIRHTLAQVKTLLKPGGLLVVNEFTAMKDVLLFTGGLLHGYWLFEDAELRFQDSCILSVGRWQEVLTTSGFQDVAALGLPFEATPSGQSVIICVKSGTHDAVRKPAEDVPTPTNRAGMAMVEEVVREIVGPKRTASLTPDTPLMEAGLDSMELLDLRMLLSKKFGVDLDATFLFQQNTLRKVSTFLLQDSRPAPYESHPGFRQTASSTENVVLQVPTAPDTPCRQHDIAIIGMALKLPGQVQTPDDFWRLLEHGGTAIGPMPEERRSWLSEPALGADKPHLRKGGFLQRIDEFDAAFFRISPREAELLDPQQRLLLELAWEVMEDAGYKPSLLSGSETGVFIGACHFDYHRLLETQGLAVEALASTGTGGSILANRVSYFYNFQGPSLVIDTACSSSLMAVHAAVRALRDGSCDQALVGGVNLICHATHTLSYDKAGMLSQDAACYTFDARANGYVRGEGAALVFLKRLDRAIQDHDRIYAVIRGSAVNHGGQASSLTAPNPEAQARVIIKAWQDAEVAPDSVTYIEAHGTGTPLGDPIEVEGIRQAIAQSPPGGFQGSTCGLGSLKANIGHLEGAAGIAGLIKVLLCLQHQTLVKSINFQTLNPAIKLTAPLYIVDQTQPWQPLRDQAGMALPRRAGVSSFGFGGANAHVVLEEFPHDAGDHHFAGPYVFVLSARDQSRLLAYAERFFAFLEQPEAAALSLRGMTYTLQNSREEMDERLAILCTDLTQLREKLQGFCAGQHAISDLYHGNVQRSAAEYDLLTAGPAGRTFIQHLIAERAYERLALLWVKGARIEWTAVFGNQRPAKVRLPTYPFARERYWVPQIRMARASSASTPDNRVQALPNFTFCLEAADQATADQAGHDDHTLILQPTWACVSRATFQAIQPFPTAVDRLVIVDGCEETAGEQSAAYRHALRQRYPGAHRLLIRPEDTVDTMARTLEELSVRLGGALDHIFWITDGACTDPVSIARRDLAEDQRRAVLPLFRLIKALLRVGYGTRPLGWTLITTRAQPIHQQDTINPAQAGLHGLIGSLAKEFPHWKIRLIDLDEPRGADGRAVDLLLDDLLTLPPDPEGNAWVCRGFTGGAPGWFKHQLVPVALPAVSRSRYRSGGIYVVIGGAGGVGEVWSDYMLRTYGAHIVWINRRPKDQVVQAKLDRLASLGPELYYISADATDEAALRRAYEDIKARYGQINGVVHAAVRLLDQSLVRMDEARFLAGLAAKVDTSVQMARIFQREPLDFMLFFSSIMTFLKPPGQANYAAGCTFQDAFAHQLGGEWSRPPSGPVVKVMHWGYWGSVGVSASETYRERMAQAGLGPLNPSEAMSALEALLAGPFDRLALVKTVHPTIFPLPPGEGQGEGSRAVAPSLGGRGSHSEPYPYLDDNLLDRVLAVVLRAASHALEVDPDDLDTDVDLHEYGFDPVSLADMTREINRTYGFDEGGFNLGTHLLTPGDLLEPRDGQAPTLRGVVRFLMDAYGDVLRQAFPIASHASTVVPVMPPQQPTVADAAPKLAAAGATLVAYVKTTIADCLARSLKTPATDIDEDVPFSEYGLESILTAAFVADVNNRLGIAMNEAIVFDHTTVKRLAAHAVHTYGADIEHTGKTQGESPPPKTVSHLQVPAWPGVRMSTHESDEPCAPVKTIRAPWKQPAAATDIAVIGMSGQFPDAGDIHSFWENLMAGRDCVHELPAHCLDQAAYFNAEKQPGKTYSRWGGILQDRDCFDPLFFNISPREARSMSPHQRLILQESWKSLEDAGYNPKELAEKPVGVFVGAEPANYFHETFTGTSDAIMASRLSYYLNLRGPAMVVNTACSSSGVAIHLACESLRHGESSLALAGGVFVLTDASLLVQLSAMEMLSPTGRCHSFDTRGDGMVVSEGVGVVVLKRLGDAIADRDPILGVIQASGVNQDGASNGITAPSGAAQEELIASVYQRFRINPEEIGYVEAHGTGTRLGDPVEAGALVRAFRRFTDKQHFCAVGSAKAAIGHTAASAAVVSLIKVLLSLKHRAIPGLVGLQQLNPLMELDTTPFYVNTQPQPWHAIDGQPRLAALNSFGHSGTNVHLVIREYLPEPQLIASPVHGVVPVFIPLSARTSERLTVYAEHLSHFLSSPAGRSIHLGDVAHTLQVGREAMKERVLFLVRDIPELVAKLKDFAAGMRSIDGCWVGRVDRNSEALQAFTSDEDSREMLTRWIARGEYAKIAAWWTRGVALDWRMLDGIGQAATRRPRRISLPTYPFAKEHYWAAPSASDRETIPSVMHTISTPLSVEDSRIAHILANGELLNRDLDDLLCKLLWGILQSLGLCREEHLRRSHFETIAGIDKKYRSWLEESLNMLVTMGYLVEARDGHRVVDPSPVDLDLLWREWDRQKAVWSWDPGKKTQVALVDATLRFLPLILTGQRQVTDFLFPDSSMELVEGIYTHNLVADFFNEALADVLVAYIGQRLAYRASDTRLHLRILEIGAGTGGTTGVVLSRLQPYVDHIEEYSYTDLSTAFLDHAQKRFAPGHPFLKTRIFNMEAPASALDLARGAYDVIIATNAIHAACRVRQPLGNIKAILKKHGLLLLNEMSSKPQPFFIHVSLALLDGWWLYEDPELRIPGCPGLLPRTWERLLQEEGFRSVFFPVKKAHGLGQQIVIAESDGIGTLSSRERAGGEGSQRLVKSPQPNPLPRGEGQEEIRHNRRDAVLAGAGVTGTRLDEHVKATIIESLSISLGVDVGRIDMDEPFADYGVDSITAVNLVQVLNRAFRLDAEAHPLATTALFDDGSVNQLAAHLLSQYGSVIAATLNGAPMPTLEIAPMRPAALELEAVRPSAWAVGRHDHADAIAVVGMSGRFPGSDTLEAFWQHLITGTDLVQEVSRWDLAPYFPDASPEHRTYCAHGSFLEHIDQFDPLFFKISALEATYMDPQQRFFLEESWKALEEAGYAGDAIRGKRCGVYVGCVSGDYAKLFRDEPPEQAFWGNAASIIPARIAYYLDLQGPAIAVDTACSSSAVAIHLACQALRTGEIDMALAGGVYIQSTPELYISASRAGMLSLTGRCFTFDQRADGFVPGEGVGVLVLKRLPDAIADGDHICGVIRGSGINQDGTTNGITAPSAKSQERLLREVYDRFNINPAHIQMVEAHGTGTILGDPIEVEALTRAFRHYTDQEAYCALGTVKTNIGHTSMTAGVAGVLKILLAMKHQQIPPALHYDSPNVRIAFEHSPFYVNTQPCQWTVNEHSTRCGVTSAFGFSGTNAHLVIEDAPGVERHHAPMPGYLCVLSARTSEQLRRRAEDLLGICERPTAVDLGNMCYTLLLGRSHDNHRLACVVRTVAELIRYLRMWLERGSLLQVYVAEIPEGHQRQRASLTRYGNQCIEGCRQTDDPGEYLEHLATIADLYIQGYRLEFGQLFSDGYTRLPLPTYPFARESYWAPGAALPAPNRAAFSDRRAVPVPPVTIHSLLHRDTSNFTGQRFSSHFSGREFFLADHWIAGRQLLPAVVQLEMARAAVVAAEGRRVEDGLRLHDIIWAQPLVVDESIGEIQISLVPQAHPDDRAAQVDRILFEIYTESSAGERLVHSQGSVSLSAPTGASTLDLSGLRAQISRDRLSAEQCYEAFRALGMHHGPSLQGLDAVFRGDAQVLARLRPPPAADDLVMHPAMLDAALQACFFLLTAEGDTEVRLPFALAELELLHPGTTPAWAWLRRVDTAGQVDIDLCDEQGHVCLRFKGLSFRARAETPTTVQALLLEPSWEERAVSQGTDRFDRHLVVLAGMDGLARKDIEAGIVGCRCLLLPVSDQPIEERFQHHAVQVFEAVQELLRQNTGAHTLLQVVCPAQGQEWLYTALAGLLSIATEESPSIVGQLIELDPGEDLVARLQENSGSPEARHVRYLHGKRYVSSWRALDAVGQQAASPWQDGGTYLITGGLGGLGLIVAREIAARTQSATLILAGRSPLAPHGHAIEELRALGARVEYHQVDVAAADQVDHLIRYIREEASSRVAGSGINGPLQGIIHAAGVHHDNRIVNKTAAELIRVLAPKVAGTANLDRATRDLDLDVFVLFSSIAVAMGNPGQADYATANAFMDAYAAWRNSLVASGQRRGRTLSINWPLWQEGRMRADREIERIVAQRTGLVAMKSSVGIRALVQALAMGKDQVMVLNGDPRKLSAALSTGRSSPNTAGTGTHAIPRQETLPDAATSDLRHRAYDYFKKQIGAVVQLPPHRIDADAALERYGFDSILLMKMTNTLEETFGSLSKTLLFEYPNIRALTTYFVETSPDKLYALLGPAAPESRAGVSEPPEDRLHATDLGDRRTGNTADLNGDRHVARQAFMSASLPAGVRELVATDIAVIGLTGRYAQASDIAEFWDNLKAGKDCITELPKERLDLERYFDPDKDKPGKVYCRWGGFINGVDQFDPLFFNISPRVATLMDPAERLFLETVWNLFEDSGHTRKRLQQRHEGKVGVFVGAMHQQYLLFDADLDSASTVSLSTHSHLANRVSYFFNLQGPSIAVDTMCSSSLTAVHMACQSLLRGECTLAVAGGANFSLHPKKFIGLSRTRSVASQPDRRSFGDGDGLLPADGVGAVLLKPLSRAIAEGDEILAVIKSTATNHGGYANGFYVPNPQAQAQLLIDNFEKSGIDPRTIGYVEAAANGSALADPIELTALNKAFARFTDERGFCAIGSVKSNIGHSEAASGMAQLAKVILQLRHGQLVPSIKARPLNPNISFADTPFYLQETLSEWQRPRLEVTDPDGRRLEQETPRRATISSFGAGGSNAHLIIEEYVPDAGLVMVRPVREATPHIVVFSAKSPERLRVVVGRMLDFLVAAEPAPALADLAYTLQVGREAMTSRLAMVVRHWEELLQGMAAFLKVPGGPEIASIPIFMGDTEEDQGIDDLLASAAVRQVLLHERDLKKLARYWTRGGDIPWEVLHKGEQPRLIRLPTYPFARERYWLAVSPEEPYSEPAVEPALEPEAPSGVDRDRVQTFLLHFLSRELRLTLDQVRPHRDLRDYGADSVTAMRLIRGVEQEFHVKMTGRDLLEHRTLHALWTYLASKIDEPQAASHPLLLGEGMENPPRKEGGRELEPVQPAALDALDQFQQGLLTLEDMEALLEQGEIV